MKNLKRWFEERYLDGDKMQDGHSVLSSKECFEAIKDALAEREKEIVEMIRKKYYIIGSTGSSGDEEQDKVNKENVIKFNGYNEAITEIINLIKNNERRN